MLTLIVWLHLSVFLQLIIHINGAPICCHGIKSTDNDGCNGMKETEAEKCLNTGKCYWNCFDKESPLDLKGELDWTRSKGKVIKTFKKSKTAVFPESSAPKGTKVKKDANVFIEKGAAPKPATDIQALLKADLEYVVKDRGMDLVTIDRYNVQYEFKVNDKSAAYFYKKLSAWFADAVKTEDAKKSEKDYSRIAEVYEDLMANHPNMIKKMPKKVKLNDKILLTESEQTRIKKELAKLQKKIDKKLSEQEGDQDTTNAKVKLFHDFGGQQEQTVNGRRRRMPDRLTQNPYGAVGSAGQGAAMQHQAVGRIVYLDPDTDTYEHWCTGTFISPRVVIAAAHCIYNKGMGADHWYRPLVQYYMFIQLDGDPNNPMAGGGLARMTNYFYAYTFERAWIFTQYLNQRGDRKAGGDMAIFTTANAFTRYPPGAPQAPGIPQRFGIVLPLGQDTYTHLRRATYPGPKGPWRLYRTASDSVLDGTNNQYHRNFDPNNLFYFEPEVVQHAESGGSYYNTGNSRIYCTVSGGYGPPGWLTGIAPGAPAIPVGQVVSKAPKITISKANVLRSIINGQAQLYQHLIRGHGHGNYYIWRNLDPGAGANPFLPAYGAWAEAWDGTARSEYSNKYNDQLLNEQYVQYHYQNQKQPHQKYRQHDYDYDDIDDDDEDDDEDEDYSEQRSLYYPEQRSHNYYQHEDYLRPASVMDNNEAKGGYNDFSNNTFMIGALLLLSFISCCCIALVACICGGFIGYKSYNAYNAYNKKEYVNINESDEDEDQI